MAEKIKQIENILRVYYRSGEIKDFKIKLGQFPNELRNPNLKNLIVKTEYIQEGQGKKKSISTKYQKTLIKMLSDTFFTDPDTGGIIYIAKNEIGYAKIEEYSQNVSAIFKPSILHTDKEKKFFERCVVIRYQEGKYEVPIKFLLEQDLSEEERKYLQ